MNLCSYIVLSKGRKLNVYKIHIRYSLLLSEPIVVFHNIPLMRLPLKKDIFLIL